MEMMDIKIRVDTTEVEEAAKKLLRLNREGNAYQDRWSTSKRPALHWRRPEDRA